MNFNDELLKIVGFYVGKISSLPNRNSVQSVSVMTENKLNRTGSYMSETKFEEISLKRCFMCLVYEMIRQFLLPVFFILTNIS